jgi:hypothetical protein
MRKFLVACVLIALAALLVGCGRPSTADSTPPTAIAPTVTTAPTPVATHGAVTSGHACENDTSGQFGYVRIGDLKVSDVHFMLSYPARQLPATVNPSHPYQLPSSAYDPPNPPVNPHTSNGAGYGLTICNTSSAASHVIVGMTTTIADFTPFNGTLNAWQFCDSVYERPEGIGGGGCGGAYLYDEALQASFAPNATKGAQVSAALVGTGNGAGGGTETAPLPVSLGPGQMLVLSIGVTPPTAPGTYTIAFGLTYDTIASAPISTMQPTLFDSAAIQWNGEHCTKPALLSQIPSTVTNPPTQYICAP